MQSKNVTNIHLRKCSVPQRDPGRPVEVQMRDPSCQGIRESPVAAFELDSEKKKNPYEWWGWGQHSSREIQNNREMRNVMFALVSLFLLHGSGPLGQRFLSPNLFNSFPFILQAQIHLLCVRRIFRAFQVTNWLIY